MGLRRQLGVILAVVVAATAAVVLAVRGDDDGETALQSRMWRQVVVADDGWIVRGATRDGSTVHEALWQVGRDGQERRLPSPSPEGMVSALTVDGTTLVAAGSEGRDAAVWKFDGDTWALAYRHSPAGADVVSAVFSTVAAAGGRLVAAGHVISETSRPIAATEGPDGWVDGDLPGGSASVMGLAATGGGFVAVGARHEPPAAVAWTSGDGLAWSLEQIPDGGDTDGRGAAQFVASRGNRVLAIGVHGRANAAWTRAGDGWSGPTRLPDPVPGRGVQAIAATQAGFVAVGHVVGRGDVVAPEGWLSLDGSTWQPLSVAGADVGRLVAVFEDDSGVVVVGEAKSGAPVLHDLRGRSLVRRD